MRRAWQGRQNKAEFFLFDSSLVCYIKGELVLCWQVKPHLRALWARRWDCSLEMQNVLGFSLVVWSFVKFFPLINCIWNLPKGGFLFYKVDWVVAHLWILGTLLLLHGEGIKGNTYLISTAQIHLFAVVPSNLTMCVLDVEVVSFPLADFVTTWWKFIWWKFFLRSLSFISAFNNPPLFRLQQALRQ